MITTSLFDAVTRDGHSLAGCDAPFTARLATFVSDLANAALTDLARLKQYEALFPIEVGMDRTRRLNILQCVWNLFAQWVEEAEQIVARAKVLKKGGTKISELPALEDGIGSTRARLSVTAEQTNESIEQSERGEGVPTTIEELRNELRARVHAARQTPVAGAGVFRTGTGV